MTVKKQRHSDSTARSDSTKSEVQLALPIAGPEDGDIGYPTAEVDTKNEKTTKPKKDKTRSKWKRKNGRKADEKKAGGKNDVEANEVRVKTVSFDELNKNYDPREEEKTFKCCHIRLAYADLCKIIALWSLIAGLALSVQVVERMLPNNKAPVVDREITTCSLCPEGKSVTDPLQEITRTDFQCVSTDPMSDSMCFFECENSLPTSRVYTCGEVEQLAKEISNNCSYGADSCREFQQADTQCCHETL